MSACSSAFQFKLRWSDNRDILQEAPFFSRLKLIKREILNCGEAPTRPISSLHSEEKKGIKHNHSKAVYYSVEMLQV